MTKRTAWIMIALLSATSAFADAGNSLTFDGSNDYVNIGNDKSLNVGNMLTIEAWVYSTDLSTRQGIFSTRLNNEGGSFQLEVGYGSGGTGRVAVAGISTWVAETGDDAILPGEWTHIAYVRSDVSNQTLYVNGVAQSLTQESTTYAFTNNTSDKVIASGTSGGQLFSGSIDEIRIWKAARTEAEILDNMHRELNGDETGLVAYFPMNQSGTSVLQDLTANHNDGTISGATFTNSTIPCADDIADATNLRAAWISKDNPTHNSSILTLSDPDITGTDFVVFGHDGGKLSMSSTNFPGAVAGRLARTWQFEVNGTLTGDLSFDSSSLTDSGDPDGLCLLVDDDGDFSDATVYTGSYTSETFTVTNQLYQDAGYCTLGQQRTQEYGDASAPYPTLFIDDGARHVATGPTLGATRDSEADGAPSANADGDGADEDGVSGWTGVRVGAVDASVTVNVQNAPSGARLDAWIDWNQDGCWGGSRERIAQSVAVSNGDNVMTFDVPPWAESGTTFARFRLSTAGVLTPHGPAADGEVEDDQLTVAAPVSSDPLFERHLITSSAAGSASVVAVDLDGDGDLDLVGTSTDDDELAWYENDGALNPTFTRTVISTDLDFVRGLSIEDMDGDGDFDILAAGAYENEVGWFENDGAANPSFSYHVIAVTEVPLGGWELQAADLTADGNLDILVANYFNGGELFWFESDGATPPSFTRHSLGITQTSVDVSAVDLDGDGDLDIVNMQENDVIIDWFENNGDGTSFTAHEIDTGNTAPGMAMAPCDADGDGDVDLFVAYNNMIIWCENDGGSTPSFTTHEIGRVETGDETFDLFPADLDGDGDVDVASMNHYGMLTWIENDGAADPSFTIHELGDVGRGESVAAGDLDGDGDLDLITAEDDQVAWYEQFGYISISATAGEHGSIAPSGTVQVVEGGSANFTITPETYWHVDDVTTNGVSAGAVTNFTWSNITQSGTIHAAFSADLAAQGTPHWWLASYGLTNGGWTFNQAETNNPDSDPYTTADEYVLDYNPNVSNDWFRITAISNRPLPTVLFQSSSNRLYTLMCSTNLLSTNAWIPVASQTGVSGTGGLEALQSTNNLPAEFYKVRVELP